MKRRIYFLAGLLMVTVGVNSCKKNVTATPRIGKLVVIGACAHYIVQLIDSTAADSSVLTKSWTDPNTDSTYSNVFSVSDICTFVEANLPVGSEFSFTLNGPVPVQNCFECDIMPFSMPAASNSVTNIKLLTIH
jgi:hypothetical protein